MQPEQLRRLLSELGSIECCRPCFSKLRPRPILAEIEALLQAVDPFRFVAGFSFNIPAGQELSLHAAAEKIGSECQVRCAGVLSLR